MTTKTPQGRVLLWFSALASGIILLMLCVVSMLMLYRGLSLFWPAPLVQFQYSQGTQTEKVYGEVVSRQHLTPQQLQAAGHAERLSGERILVKQGYHGVGQPTFRWFWQDTISEWTRPPALALVEHVTLGEIYGTLSAGQLTLANGTTLALSTADIVRQLQPNQLTTLDKLKVFSKQWWLFLSTAPREANSAGGILPALVGTLLSVMLMALMVAPIGIMAGVYLHEYARDGRLVRLVRLSVHNLAGVPSVVFGVFALVFFVYGLGGSIDTLFYADKLPQPTFGTPSLIWVSLTLALLTLPVVIVATEEGLARVPVSLRLGGYGVGATKAEVLYKLVLPVARPALLTGVILAISRAAGEVAPLLFVGVVKYAPVLPLSQQWPFIQPEQQIMSLGFQIYDVGLQSSNADAAEPRVYAIAMVLLLLIGSLNLLAMQLRRYYRIKMIKRLN